MEKYLTGSGLLTAAIVILALAWAWNLIYTAMSNARKMRERSDEPINQLREKVNDLHEEIRDLETRVNDMCRDVNNRVDAIQRGMETHTTEIADLHAGQTELCRGVQALLEHALHNGNEAAMSAASQSIGEWLRTR